MIIRIIHKTIFLIMVLICGLLSQSLIASEELDIQSHLNELVNTAQVDNNLVGFGAVVLQDNKIIASAVKGERELRGKVAITIEDKWHIGSISKSITATMLAKLVEEEKLAWDDTLKDLFPDFDGLHESWDQVTLHQLLTHTSGIKPNFSPLLLFKKVPEGKKRTKARLQEVKKILSLPPASQAGTKFSYSNIGYTIAGVIAEQETGKTWENLVREFVFEPLSITSGGFGPPKDTGDLVDQPRGHRKGLFGVKKSVGTEFDNTPIMGPAGIIHMSLLDLAKYTNDHMLGVKGKGLLLKADTYKRLHTPELESYAYGWVVFDEREWLPGPVIWHNGTNTAWFALTVFMPELNTVVSLASNDGDYLTSEKAAFKIVKEVALQIQNEHQANE